MPEWKKTEVRYIPISDKVLHERILQKSKNVEKDFKNYIDNEFKTTNISEKYDKAQKEKPELTATEGIGAYIELKPISNDKAQNNGGCNVYIYYLKDANNTIKLKHTHEYGPNHFKNTDLELAPKKTQKKERRFSKLLKKLWKNTAPIEQEEPETSSLADPVSSNDPALNPNPAYVPRDPIDKTDEMGYSVGKFNQPPPLYAQVDHHPFSDPALNPNPAYVPRDPIDKTDEMGYSVGKFNQPPPLYAQVDHHPFSDPALNPNPAYVPRDPIDETDENGYSVGKFNQPPPERHARVDPVSSNDPALNPNDAYVQYNPADSSLSSQLSRADNQPPSHEKDKGVYSRLRRPGNQPSSYEKVEEVYSRLRRPKNPPVVYSQLSRQDNPPSPQKGKQPKVVYSSELTRTPKVLNASQARPDPNQISSISEEASSNLKKIRRILEVNRAVTQGFPADQSEVFLPKFNGQSLRSSKSPSATYGK